MRLRLSWKKSTVKNKTPRIEGKDFNISLKEAGQLLRERREHYGLSLRELAIETKITTPVLEAIEKGWSNRLPEPAYLCSMLPILEARLGLATGKLNGALTFKEKSNKRLNRQFTLDNVNVFTTWQGNFLYFIVMCGSLLFLNNQQRHITALNSQTLEPIRPNLTSLEAGKSSLIRQSALERLRPIGNAIGQSANKRILSTLNELTINKQIGYLQISLKTPRSIILNSSGNENTNLKNVQGDLNLQLMLPLTIEISPPLNNNDSIKWNGQILYQIKEKPGFYKLDDK